MPLPVQNFRHILANLVDVVLVGDELVVHLLDEVRAAVAQLGQMQQGVLDQMETVDLILHTHIKRRGDGALLLVAVHGQVVVGALIGQLMHQRRVAMEREDDGLILRKQRIIIGIGQAVRVLGVGLKLYQVNDVDDADLQLRHRVTQDGDGSQRFRRGGIVCPSDAVEQRRADNTGAVAECAGCQGGVFFGVFITKNHGLYSSAQRAEQVFTLIGDAARQTDDLRGKHIGEIGNTNG